MPLILFIPISFLSLFVV